MLLAALFPGGGHLYVGSLPKAITIWALAAGLWALMITNGFVPFVFAYVLGGLFYIWDAGDDAKIFNSQNC